MSKGDDGKFDKNIKEYEDKLAKGVPVTDKEKLEYAKSLYGKGNFLIKDENYKLAAKYMEIAIKIEFEQSSVDYQKLCEIISKSLADERLTKGLIEQKEKVALLIRKNQQPAANAIRLTCKRFYNIIMGKGDIISINKDALISFLPKDVLKDIFSYFIPKFPAGKNSEENMNIPKVLCLSDKHGDIIKATWDIGCNVIEIAEKKIILEKECDGMRKDNKKVIQKKSSLEHGIFNGFKNLKDSEVCFSYAVCIKSPEKMVKFKDKFAQELIDGGYIKEKKEKFSSGSHVSISNNITFKSKTFCEIIRRSTNEASFV